MEDEALPLPSLEEVLICNTNTTAEEVRVKTVIWVHMNMYYVPLRVHVESLH